MLHKYWLPLSICFTILFAKRSLAQQSDGAKTAIKIELSALPGYELPQRTDKYGLDTANFRPGNFSFRIWDKKDLTDRLEMGVHLPEINCKPSWGTFMFRVNARGEVDTTSYRGNLSPGVSSKILANICATEGNWMIKSGTHPSNVAWFMYAFFDVRGRIPKKKECSDSDLELLDAVSSLSNLFWILHYQVGRDFHRATMIRPTEIDGTPKL
jgi:hypothetical protein